jgi:glycosyltransferase involved in cell wall biosynthesis
MLFLILGAGLMGIIQSENADPRVTVLIPCNSTDFLAECLASVACQDYSNIDVLVVLNGQAIHERTALIEEFNDYPRTLNFVLSKKVGIVGALNLGLELSSNEYIARIDADDVMPSNRITLQIEEFSRDSEIVCIGGQLKYLAAAAGQKHPGYPLTDEAFRHALYRFSPLPHPGVMYKKSAVVLAGMYREKFPYIEDWDLWTRLAEQGKIFNLSETTVYYRIHSNQSTTIHTVIQQKSIRSLSSEILKQTVKASGQQYLRDSDSLDPQSIAIIPQPALIGKKQRKGNGLFGQKTKRRALAGYLYIRMMSSNSSRAKLLLSRIVISLIDPALIIRKLF